MPFLHLLKKIFDNSQIGFFGSSSPIRLHSDVRYVDCLPDRFNQKNPCAPMIFYRNPTPGLEHCRPARIQKSPGTIREVPGDFLQPTFFIGINLFSDPEED
jgi:hypothetical protein